MKKIIIFLSFMFYLFANDDINELIKKTNEDKNNPKLYTQIANIYYENKEYKKALEYYKKALMIFEVQNPPLEMYFGDIYQNISIIYANQNNPKLAIENAITSLKIYKNIDKSEKKIINSYTLLANIYRKYNEINKAFSYYKMALQVDKNNIENKDTVYKEIGIAYLQTNDLRNALKYFLISLKIRKKIYKKDDVQISDIYSYIANVYKQAKEYKNGLKYYNLALAIDEKNKDKYPNTLSTTYNNLASIFVDIQDYKKALMFYRKALEIATEKENVANIYNNMGICYKKSGDFENSMMFYNMALKIDEKLFDKNHQNIARDYNNIANLYFTQKDYPKALDYYEKAYEILKNYYPENSEYLLNIQKAIKSIKNQSIDI